MRRASRIRIVGLVAISLVAIAGCSSGSSSSTPKRTTSTSSRVSTTTTTAVPIAPEGWKLLSQAPTVLGRYRVWTGHEYIGGPSGCCDDLGGSEVLAYNPATLDWRHLAPFPLPLRTSEVAAWTGHEMVVVGGREARSATDTTNSDSVPTTSGTALDPSTNTWHTIASMPAPMDLPLGAIWTGKEVIVFDHTHVYLYTPATNRWRTGAAPPFARDGMTTVWTGRQLLLWGGTEPLTSESRFDNLVVHGDGAAYDPSANRWTTIPVAPVPARTGATAVWTGHQMILWGGLGPGGTQGTGDRGPLGKGAAYDPASRSWRALPASPLKARFGHRMVWTGREAIVWGGSVASNGPDPLAGYPRDGAAYDPATNTWRTLMPAPPSPPALLTAFSAVWTGTTVLLIGGDTSNEQAIGPLGLAYSPGR